MEQVSCSTPRHGNGQTASPCIVDRMPTRPPRSARRCAGRVARAGRTGRALSLLTREELPYLLDLHLFLSRPLLPAPVAPLAAAREAADGMDPTTSLYGCFPQVTCLVSSPARVSFSDQAHAN